MGTSMQVRYSNLIDVTIPTWNRQSVYRTIKSCTGAASITVVDDGSYVTPEVPEHCDFIRVNHCGMPGRIKNLGICNGSAPYVCIVDDDDYLLPNALQEVEQFIKANNYPKVVMTYQKWLEKDGSLTDNVTSVISPWVMRQLVVVSRELFNEVQGFPENIPAAVDSYYYAKLWDKAEVSVLPKALYVRDIANEDRISVRLKDTQYKQFLDNMKIFTKD